MQTVMAEHNDLGKWGEEVAACYLENLGYIIKGRGHLWSNWRQYSLLFIPQLFK